MSRDKDKLIEKLVKDMWTSLMLCKGTREYADGELWMDMEEYHRRAKEIGIDVNTGAA